MITQKDIANRLNISIATVSRALQSDEAINSVTRTRVREIAQKMGYFNKKTDLRETYDTDPLFSNEVKNICAVVNFDFSNYREVDSSAYAVTHYMIEGLSNKALEYGVNLTIKYLRTKEGVEALENSEHQQNFVGRGKIQGLVLIWPFERDVVDNLSNSYSIISLNHRYSGLPVDCISFNQPGGIETLVFHLHSLCHKKIGFLDYNLSNLLVYPRFQGYMTALAKLGIEFDPDCVINVFNKKMLDDRYQYADLDKVQFCEKVKRLLEEKDVTAWVCATSRTAYELYDGLERIGVKVPDDISITGFDYAQTYTDKAELTNVLAPYDVIGEKALEQLCRRIEQEETDAVYQEYECVFSEGDTVKKV